MFLSHRFGNLTSLHDGSEVELLPLDNLHKVDMKEQFIGYRSGVDDLPFLVLNDVFGLLIELIVSQRGITIFEADSILIGSMELFVGTLGYAVLVDYPSIVLRQHTLLIVEHEI